MLACQVCPGSGECQLPGFCPHAGLCIHVKTDATSEAVPQQHRQQEPKEYQGRQHHEQSMNNRRKEALNMMQGSLRPDLSREI